MTSTGSYLDGLLAFGDGVQPIQTSKDGSMLFDGAPFQFEEWKSKAQACIEAARLEEEKPKQDKELAKVGYVRYGPRCRLARC